MRSTIERPIQSSPLDFLIIEFAHGRRRYEGVERHRRELAVVVVSALQVDQHITLRFIVADALNEAAAGRVSARERL